MAMNCLNGIDANRLRATRDLIEGDVDRLFANPLNESTLVWKNGCRTVSHAKEQLVASGASDRTNPPQSLQIMEE
jgi:hypothetical protein